MWATLNFSPCPISNFKTGVSHIACCPRKLMGVNVSSYATFDVRWLFYFKRGDGRKSKRKNKGKTHVISTPIWQLEWLLSVFHTNFHPQEYLVYPWAWNDLRWQQSRRPFGLFQILFQAVLFFLLGLTPFRYGSSTFSWSTCLIYPTIVIPSQKPQIHSSLSWEPQNHMIML